MQFDVVVVVDNAVRSVVVNIGVVVFDFLSLSVRESNK